MSGFDHHDLQHGEVEQDLHPQDLIDEQTDLAVGVQDSAANRLIGEVVQSRRRPLLGPSPG